MRVRGASFGLFLLLVLGGWDWLRSEDPDVSAGNGAYSAGNFGEALELYERSADSPGAEPGSEAAIRFDVGAALYKLAEASTDETKQGEYLERAESAFRQATDTDDPLLKSGAYHNLGNSFFLRERWPQAAEAYKKALRANQDNDDARYNLELALRKQKKNDKQKSSQQQKGQGQGQQPKNPGQGQQQKPKGSNDPGGQNQDDPNAKDPGQKGQGQGQQKQDDQKNPDGTDKNQPSPGQGQNNDPNNTPNKDPGAQGQPNSDPANPQNGQGTPQNQPQQGQGQPNGSNRPNGQKPGSDPSAGDPARNPRPGDDANGDRVPGDGESKSDRDRKLDSLENRSKDQRRRRLRRGGSSDRRGRFNNPKDW